MQGDSYSLLLPDNLRPGDYLIRHEIIALHLAVTRGGAEFYPSCTQIRVGGSGTGTPSDTVTFPGAYSDNDPGIFDPTVSTEVYLEKPLLSRSCSPADVLSALQVFDNDSTYVFPGPAISNLAATDGEITAPLGNTASFHSAASATATATGKASSKASSASSTHVSSPSASAGSGSGATQNAASSSSKAQCRLKASATASVYPRHYSRIMRRILHTSGI